MDSGTTGGTAGQTGTDASDGRLADVYRIDAPVGSNVVLFEENFDTDFGKFALGQNCGTPPDWIHIDAVDSHVKADDPATNGMNSLVSPPIPIPANVSNIRLRLRHQVVTQAGYDGAQILVSRNGGAPNRRGGLHA